jgi:uncharacterized protein (DUF983 family)
MAKRCPRCVKGRLFLEREITGWEWRCLSCGRCFPLQPTESLRFVTRLGGVTRKRTA